MHNSQTYNEREMLASIAAGNEVAFRFFFNDWWRRIYSNALRFAKNGEQAQDMTQEVFIRLWVKREKLATVESLENYMYFVARNVFLDHLRKKVLNTENTAYLNTFFEVGDPDTQQRLEIKELQEIVLESIENLPPKMREVFKLSRFEGLTHQQISDKLGISKATSQSYIVRSLLQIRQYLTDRNYSADLLFLVAFIQAGKFL